MSNSLLHTLYVLIHLLLVSNTPYEIETILFSAVQVEKQRLRDKKLFEEAVMTEPRFEAQQPSSGISVSVIPPHYPECIRNPWFVAQLYNLTG